MAKSLSTLAGAVLAGACSAGGPDAQVRPASDYVEDFDDAWDFVQESYAYLEEKAVDWDEARHALRERAGAARADAEFVAVLENLVEHLYDHHAHLGTNTSSSPRLVPSGADVWAANHGGRALIGQVRAGSGAERAGLRLGMEVVSIGGVPVDDAIGLRLPAAVDPTSVEPATGAASAARRQHNAPNTSGHATRPRFTRSNSPPERSARGAPLSARRLDATSVTPAHDSLVRTARAWRWDAALAEAARNAGLVLDLQTHRERQHRCRPRPCCRLLAEERSYQRHELVRTPPSRQRPPLERARVAPRGRSPYEGALAVPRGRWTASMGKGLAIAIDGTRRGAVFGSPMAGLRGAIYTRTLANTGFEVRIPAEALCHVDGTPREAFVPRPMPEPATPGEDPALDAARRWIAAQPGA